MKKDPQTVYISLLGASGRMGGSIISSLGQDFQMVDAVEKPGSQAIGAKLSTVCHLYEGDEVFVDALTKSTDVVIDFAAGEGLAAVANTCVERSWALVTGRTGISDEDKTALQEASKKTAVLQAGNMSLGANLLIKLAALAAKALPDVDIEITETHHRYKKDAPSGTALALADSVAQAIGWNEEDYVYGREGYTGERPRKQLAIHTLRSGDTVGDHTVNLGTLGEKLELTHRASDRCIFARGALSAAKWIVDKKPGFYSMQDVLGL